VLWNASGTLTPTEIEMSETSNGPAFAAAEKAAMKVQHIREESTREQLQRIAKFPSDDRILTEHVNPIVPRMAPRLAPNLWCGTRYATFGFDDIAASDDGEADSSGQARASAGRGL
jgi:hypothetical protein